MKERNGNGNEPARLLNAAEVARLLRVHPNTVRLWGRIGVLKAHRIGKRRDYRFDPADIKGFLLGDEGPE